MEEQRIPILFVVDLSGKRFGFDYFRMFLACLTSLLRTAKSGLDIVVVSVGWTSRQRNVVSFLAGQRNDVGVRFFSNGDPVFEKVSRTASKYNRGNNSFGEYVWYKLAPNMFFGNDKPVIVSDIDVAFLGDVSGVYSYALKEVENGAGIVFMPDPCLRSSEYAEFRSSAYGNVGFFVADFTRFCPFDEMIDTANRYLTDVHGRYVDTKGLYPYGTWPEQDFLNRYCFENGIKMSSFLPDDVGCVFERTDGKYRYFGIENLSPFSERLDHIKVCHMLGDSKSSFFDSSTIGRRARESVLVADSALCLDARVSYPLYGGDFYRDTDVRNSVTRQSNSFLTQPKYRTVVYANSGDQRRDTYLLPSVASLIEKATCPLRIEMLYSDDSLDSLYFRNKVSEIADLFGRDVVFDYRKLDPDLDVFGNNRYGGANLLKLFSSRIFPDADSYFLYMDSDVLVIDDVKPLFLFCDTLSDVDKVAACQSHYVVSTITYQTPAHFMGGFFFMHPDGRPSKSALRRLFAEEWHDNDEYVIAQCMQKSDLVSLGDAVVEPMVESSKAGEARRNAMERVGAVGTHVYAVHFSSSKDHDRFDKSAMPRDFSEYVDRWNSMKRLVNSI